MRIAHLFVLYTLLLLIIACSKSGGSESIEEEELSEPTESEEVYFTYNKIASSSADEWIILHNEKGELLEYKRIENFEPAHFKITPDSYPSKVSVTRFIFSLTGGGVNPSHSLVSFTDLNPGSEWKVRYLTGRGPVIGSFTAIVENIPGGVRHYSLSDSNGGLNAGDTEFGGTSGNAALHQIDIPIYANETYFLSIYSNSGDLKYMRFDLPEDGAEYVIDFANLLEHDQYLEFELPENDFLLFETAGFVEEQPDYLRPGYVASRDISWGESFGKVGYPSFFSRFRTIFNITMLEYGYGYIKRGDILQGLTIKPAPVFSLSDATVYNLTFSSDQEYVRKMAHWSYNTYGEHPLSTNWTVYSAGSEPHKIGPFPQEISSQYPDLNLDKIQLQSIALFTQSLSQQEQFELEGSQNGFLEELTEEFFTFKF